MIRTTSLTIAALVLSASAWAGDVHRWVDEQGNVHYSENPPADADSERMDIQTGHEMPDEQPVTDEVAAEPEAEEATEETEGDEARPDADAVAEARRRNCETAREALETLDQHDRVQVEEEGERRFLEPEEMEEERERYEALKAEHCE